MNTWATRRFSKSGIRAAPILPVRCRRRSRRRLISPPASWLARLRQSRCAIARRSSWMNGAHTIGNRRSSGRSTRRAPFRFASRRPALEARGGRGRGAGRSEERRVGKESRVQTCALPISYDWKSPKLWPLDSTRAVPLRLATLGPRGSWRAVARRGVARVTPERGKIGEPVTVTPAGDDWEVTIESGGRKFSYGRFEPRIDWTVRLSSDSVTRLFPRLDLMWYRPPKTLAFFPAEHWSVDATGTVTVPPGVYSVRTISDDAIRV